MNRRMMLWIGLGVLAAHVLFFWLVSDFRPLPKRRYVPPPNFQSREARFVDPDTGDRIVVQEFTISTRLREDVRLAAPEKAR